MHTFLVISFYFNYEYLIYSFFFHVSDVETVLPAVFCSCFSRRPCFYIKDTMQISRNICLFYFKISTAKKKKKVPHQKRLNAKCKFHYGCEYGHRTSLVNAASRHNKRHLNSSEANGISSREFKNAYVRKNF